MSIKKIVVLGPESSGKTTLCQQLATDLHTIFVPEFARQYLEEKGPQYSFEDLTQIAEGQLKSEQKAIQQLEQANDSKWIIMDTDLHVIRIWSEIAFQKCNNRILSAIAERQYDFYLLTYPDLPWTPDPLREHADEKERGRIFHHYHDSLLNQKIPFAIIQGIGETRYQSAVRSLLDQFGDIGITS